MNLVLTAANFITFLRMISGIPLIYCLRRMDAYNEYFLYSILIVLFIIISDVLDGYIARKSNTVSSLGKIIDPVSDKICLMFVLVYLIDLYNIRFLIFFILLSIRDIVLITYTIYLILYRDYVSQANSCGKFFIFICMLMIIFHLFKLNPLVSNILYVFSIILLVVSMCIYIKEHSKRIYVN